MTRGTRNGAGLNEIKFSKSQAITTTKSDRESTVGVASFIKETIQRLKQLGWLAKTRPIMTDSKSKAGIARLENGWSRGG